jgi:hypothetical protein
MGEGTYIVERIQLLKAFFVLKWGELSIIMPNYDFFSLKSNKGTIKKVMS